MELVFQLVEDVETCSQRPKAGTQLFEIGGAHELASSRLCSFHASLNEGRAIRKSQRVSLVSNYTSVNTTDVTLTLSFLSFLPLSGTGHCEEPDRRAGRLQKGLSGADHCRPALDAGQGDADGSR